MTGNKMIRCLALLLTLAMLLPLLPALPVHAEIMESGKCGDNVTYTLDSEGVLTISGTGDMADYNFNDNRSPFLYNESIKSVVINEGVTSIGEAVFGEVQNLASVTMPDGLIKIGNSAFYRCRNMTKLSIGNDVTSIGNGAFLLCDSLRNVIIPDSVQSIGSDAFYHCYEMSSLTIGRNVRKIGRGAFDSCYGLKKVIISDIAAWCSIEYEYGSGIAYPLLYAGALYLNDSLVTDLVIPNGVTSINENAFSGCKSLMKVTIPNSVTRIGKNAFSGCTGLTKVRIPNTISSISEWAFSSCSELKRIVIPDGVKNIGELAFQNCEKLSSMTIYDSVTSIDQGAFRNCKKLTDIYYSGTESQWNDIAIGGGNNVLFNATIHFEKTEPDIDTYVEGTLENATVSDSTNGIVYLDTVTIDGKTYDVKPEVVSSDLATQLWNKQVAIGLAADEAAAMYEVTQQTGIIQNCTSSDGFVKTIHFEEQKYNCLPGKVKYDVSETMTDKWVKITFYDKFVALVEDIKPVYVQKDYDFETDSYYFPNYSNKDKKGNNIPLDLKYYEAIFEPGQSETMDQFYQRKAQDGAGTKGLCFGMACTTASILSGLPAVERINNRETLRKTNITDRFTVLSHSGSVDSYKISVDDYIKYAFVYQYNSPYKPSSYTLFEENKNVSWQGFFDEITQQIDSGRFVIISLAYAKRDEHGNLTFQDINHFESDGSHAVLAVGYEGRSILIDDPNYKDGKKQLCRLTFSDDYKDWHYDNPWSSSKPLDDDHAILIINTDFAEPYRILSTGKKVYHAETDAGETAAIVSGTERIDGGKNLLLADSAYFTLDRDDYYEVMPTYGGDDGDSDARLFWTDSDRTVTISGIEGDDNYFAFAGDHHTVSVDTAGTGDVTLTVDEENDDYSVEADATVNSEYEIAFSTLPDEDADRRVITVSGTASGETVRVAGTENGIEITGFGSATVTLADQDGNVLDTTQIRADGKQKEINVNSEKDSFVEDPTEPHTEPQISTLCGDANLDGKVLANDARLVLRASAKLETLTGQAFVNCDLNGDGKLLAGEARKILRYSAKLESTL